jgi:hypothetical protein
VDEYQQYQQFTMVVTYALPVFVLFGLGLLLSHCRAPMRREQDDE